MFDSNSVQFEIKFLDNLSSPLNQATQKGVLSLRQLEGAKGKLGKSSNSLLSSLGGLSGGLGGVLGAASGLLPILGAGAGLTGVISGVVQKGMEFTKVMSNVRALLGASETDFKKLNDEAVRLGAVTTFSSSQVAEAMVVAAQAGQDTNQIIAAMPGYLDLAASANVGLADAVEIGLSTMHQFGLSASNMDHIVDQLAYTTTKSATGMQDLAEGLKYIGPAAASMRVPLSEVLSLQGVLADRGLKGSIATRALSTSIQRLSAPTTKMAKEMGRLNLSFFDSEGKFIGVNNSVELLSTRMKGFTDEQKASTLSTLFGAEAFGEWNILLDKGADSLRTLTAEIENSQGTAAKIAKTQLDNLSGDVEQFSGAWETLQLKMFSDGESGFRSLVQIGTEALNRLGEGWDYMVKPMREVRSLFAELFTGINDLRNLLGLSGKDFDAFGLIIGRIRWHFEMITFPIRNVLKFWNWLIGGVKESVIVFQAFADTIKYFSGSIAEFFSPVTDFVSSIFSKVGEGINFVQGIFSKIGEVVSSVFGFVKNTIDGVLDYITSKFQAIADKIKIVFGPLMKLYERFASVFVEKYAARKASANPVTDQDETKGIPKSPLAIPTLPKSLLTPSTKTDDIAVNGASGGRSVIVNINKLIETFTVEAGNNIQDLEKRVKETITKSLVESIRDFETSY